MPMEDKEYVVIINRTGPIPLRHIVTISAPYNEDSFAAWYYEHYHKLEGDEFIHCTSRREMETFVAQLQER